MSYNKINELLDAIEVVIEELEDTIAETKKDIAYGNDTDFNQIVLKRYTDELNRNRRYKIALLYKLATEYSIYKWSGL